VTSLPSPPPPRRRLRFACLSALAASLLAASASAEVPVQRTVHWLPAANGHGAILLDLKSARLHHFREHLFATEEPLLDSQGHEIWSGNQPQAVRSRDLLYDAYFGVRAKGQQKWLTTLPVDLDASGYAPSGPGKKGGTGIAALVQTDGDLEATSFFFMPQGLDHNGFVMALRLKNKGSSKLTGLQAFSLHNFHLGFGRPGVMDDIGEQGETITYDKVKKDFLERAFAGVVVGRALGSVVHHAAWSSGASAAQNGYEIVAKGGTTDLPDLDGEAPTGDGSVSAFQLALGDLDPGAEAWTGVAFAHHGDPFAGATVQTWLDDYVAGKDAKQLFDAEVAGWATFQQKLKVPAGLSPDEEALYRHSAAMLHMGQSREGEYYLREFHTKDGEPRYTRFPAASGGSAPAKLPATVKHRGKGAILASMPPGEWTVSWARDSAYAIVAMATAGMKDEARMALEYYLTAEAGLFQHWDELKPYNMPPYQITLVRYHGFGVEETDFNDYGPNLEFDGFGLMLWALAQYEKHTGDTTLVDAYWPVISQKIADVLVALVDPANGLIRKDSSIWETHWNGRERYWTYTSLTAARGLCDAVKFADRLKDAARTKTYKDQAEALRQAIATKLTDKKRALASNLEELQSGDGYRDAAVFDAIAMELFDPKGTLAKATFADLDAHISVAAGAGWSRNDDRFDHPGKLDLSDWGGHYDSAEWVITNLRGAVAAQRGGDIARAKKLVDWTTNQSLANYLEVAETYDENTGTYKFNSPMLGFGAGAYILALAARTEPSDPACGAHFDESVLPPPEQGGSGSGGSGQSGSGGSAGSSGSGGSTEGSGGSGGSGGSDAGSGGGGGSDAGAGGSGGGDAGQGGSTGTSPTGGAPSGGQAGSFGGIPGSSGSSGQGGSKAAGQGGVPGATTDEPPPEESCGCRVAGGASSPPRWGLLLGLAALLRRRRVR
jgi:MYXO-CTERM domain-containing protein